MEEYQLENLRFAKLTQQCVLTDDVHDSRDLQDICTRMGAPGGYPRQPTGDRGLPRRQTLDRAHGPPGANPQEDTAQQQGRAKEEMAVLKAPLGANVASFSGQGGRVRHPHRETGQLAQQLFHEKGTAAPGVPAGCRCRGGGRRRVLADAPSVSPWTPTASTT